MAKPPSDRKPLTHARQAETAKPEARLYNLNAGGGLFLEVMPNGSKRWRLRYTHANKRKLLSMGLFPAVAIGDSPVLPVNPNGSKWWRFRYRFADKAKMLSLGVYPDVLLAEAKERRDQAHKLVAQGVDPSERRKSERKATRIETANTFEAVACK